MFSCSNNLDLNNATLTTAHTVDGVDAKPATDKQPGHQMLSHRIHPFSFSGNLQLAQMPVLRLSGDSEALLRAVILEPHWHLYGRKQLKQSATIAQSIRRALSSEADSVGPGLRHGGINPLG